MFRRVFVQIRRLWACFLGFSLLLLHLIHLLVFCFSNFPTQRKLVLFVLLNYLFWACL